MVSFEWHVRRLHGSSVATVAIAGLSALRASAGAVCRQRPCHDDDDMASSSDVAWGAWHRIYRLCITSCVAVANRAMHFFFSCTPGWPHAHLDGLDGLV